MDTATDFSRVDLLLYLTEQLESGSQAGIQEALVLATRMLGMQYGIISRVEGERYTIEQVAAEDGHFVVGQVFALDETLCRETLRVADVVGFEDLATSTRRGWAHFDETGIAAYIGVPLRGGGHVRGTLCFASRQVRIRPWTDEDRQLVRLLGHWIEASIEQGVLRQQVTRIAGLLGESNRCLRGTRKARESLLLALPDPLLVVDAAGTCQRCQRPAGSRVAFRATEAVGHPLRDFLPDEAARALTAAAEAARESGLMQLVDVFLPDAETATPRHFEARVASAEEATDRSAVILLRDLTDREETQRLVAQQAELQRTNLRLRAANQELEAFAYAASHDLKSPLRALANLATLISDELADLDRPEALRCLDLMQERVERLVELVDDLLAYSRVGRENAVVEAVETTEIIKEIVQLLAPPPGFSVEVAPDLPPLRTARAPLEQVLSNGIANAIQHHDGPVGHVRISWRPRGPLVEFRIEDDGPGIPASWRAQAFGVFRRLHGGGSGLGLALVKKTVEGVGGTAWLEEAQPRGTVLAFTWPRAWPDRTPALVQPSI